MTINILRTEPKLCSKPGFGVIQMKVLSPCHHFQTQNLVLLQNNFTFLIKFSVENWLFIVLSKKKYNMNTKGVDFNLVMTNNNSHILLCTFLVSLQSVTFRVLA